MHDQPPVDGLGEPLVIRGHLPILGVRPVTDGQELILNLTRFVDRLDHHAVLSIV